MTVVVACNWLTEAIMLADSRVSWSDNRHPPQDTLRKLYTVGGPRKGAVIGFCGDLQAARAVMRFLMEAKLRDYRRRFVIPQFRDQLCRWIEEAAETQLQPRQRTRVKFMLCGIEPSRHPPLLKGGKVVRQTPFAEVHICVYRIGANGKVVVDARPKRCAVIGTGRALERLIAARLAETLSFGLAEPKLHWARAVLAGEVIASLVAQDKKAALTVGGPLQVIRITAGGLETHYIWPATVADRNTHVEQDGARTIVTNPSTSERYILHPIWELELTGLDGTG